MSRRHPSISAGRAARHIPPLQFAPCSLRVCLTLSLWSGTPHAQKNEWLDLHVSQATIVDTICTPGYVDRVLPSFETQMRQKNRLLKQRSIDESFASEYALDHRMPVLLGGLPNSAANFDLRDSAARNGSLSI